MLLFKQLELLFNSPSSRPLATKRGRDFALEERARILLHSLGAGRIANEVHVEWQARLRTAAGRADYGRKLITLNPRLCDFGEEEVERTFLHELAHLLAHFRAGRRRIPPHGDEWRLACEDLGIGGEARCHSLPFPRQQRARLWIYRCPKCALHFPRVRRIRRAVACLACCRAFNRGHFDKRFQLKLVRGPGAA